MDSDELDQWLDVDESDGPPPRGDWSPGPAAPRGRSSPAEGRRLPWRWVAAAGGVLWACVMAAVFLGGQPSESAEPAPGATPPGGLTPETLTSGAPPTESPTARPSASQVPPAAAADAASAGEVDQPGADAPVASTSAGPQATATGPPPGIEAGAIAALRDRLTVAGETTSYLEWATPVVSHPLGAGIWLVVLDAIWLEGADGDLSTSRRQRWAVPVADDGQAMVPPWPHPSAATDPTPPPTTEPPSGDLRLGEVEQLLDRAGWTAVTGLASDPHPLVPDVLVALVEGVPPGGDAPVTEVVWLGEADDGSLTALGAER